MSAEHLTAETIGFLVDGELSNAEQAAAQQHWQGCHACSLRLLEAHQLKGAIRRSARRFSPSTDAMARLSSVVRQAPAQHARAVPVRPVVWTSIAAALLIALILGGWRVSSEQTALAANLLDQHLASLSDASLPQIISTDRHTVKPWFQGKLPFSFNLPEAGALPPETVLQGADFTYLAGKPAALLLFTIHKHRASVFVTQAERNFIPEVRPSRAGFNFSYAHASGLDLCGVSDASRSELDKLVEELARVQ